MATIIGSGLLPGAIEIMDRLSMQAATAAAYARPLTEAENLKCRVDAVVAVLFDKFEPRP